jgi:pimeloyl-ACP methyl ester carboxylesterase
MSERTLLFGEGKSLVGIVTEPATAAAATARPAVILLNAGVLHRVGPNRLHVRLARRLAEAGFLVMRFDYSGTGDSRPRDGSLPFVRSALAETRQCMDLLSATRGVDRFLLAGLCSGADNALFAAGQDPRVVGAALLEPYTVPGPGFLLYQYRRKLLNPLAWLRLLGGRSEILGMLLARRKKAPAPAPAAPVVEAPQERRVDSMVPSREEFVKQVETLLARDVRLCLVYSSEGPAYFNYLQLLRKALRRALKKGQARLHVRRHTDHAFTPLAAQDFLMDAVSDWAAGFGPAPVSGAEHRD